MTEQQSDPDKRLSCPVEPLMHMACVVTTSRLIPVCRDCVNRHMIIPEPTIAPDRAVLNRIRERLEMDLVDNTSEYNDGYNGGLNMAICEIGAELENFPFQCHLRCKNHVACGKSGYDKVCADFAPKQDSSESFSVIDKALLKEWADWCAKCREYMKVTEETLALHGAAIDAEQVSGNQTDQRIIVLAASIAKIESVVKDIAGVLVKLTN